MRSIMDQPETNVVLVAHEDISTAGVLHTATDRVEAAGDFPLHLNNCERLSFVLEMEHGAMDYRLTHTGTRAAVEAPTSKL